MGLQEFVIIKKQRTAVVKEWRGTQNVVYHVKELGQALLSSRMGKEKYPEMEWTYPEDR